MKKSDKNLTAILWILLGIVGRLIPHPPNMTPMTSLSLFGGTHLSRKMAFGIAFSTLVISDVLIAYIYAGWPAFGLWTFFTYTGFAAIVFAGTLLRTNPTALKTLGFILGSSLGFWIWTNFGVWLAGGPMYARSFEGLISCYMAALPFLRNALVGDLFWGFAFFASFSGVRVLAPKFGWSVQGA